MNAEFGGMNELAYNLYAVSNDPAHLQLAHYFYKGKFMDPLAAGVDSLNGNHANTHLPEVIGVARGWEVEGNVTLKDITTTFYKFLSTEYMYEHTTRHYDSSL